MLRKTQISFALVVAASPLIAQSIMTPAPVPGPYHVSMQPQFKAPAVTFNQPRFAPPMPYWMQVQPPQTATPQPRQAPTVSRSAQQPTIATGWGNATQVPRGAPTPGFFPGSTGNLPAFQPRAAPNTIQTQRPAPNYTQNFGQQPWGQQWSPQYMPTPWGNGWNNTGYPQAYAPRPQQQR